MTSVHYDNSDDNCWIGNDDEGASCPTCGTAVDPETYTMRMFIKDDSTPENGVNYDTFVESITKVSDITQYDLVHSYEYEMEGELYGRTVTTYGTIELMKLNNNIYVMKLTFSGVGDSLEVYAKTLDQIKTHTEQIYEHYLSEIGSCSYHCIEQENFDEAIDQAIEKP